MPVLEQLARLGAAMPVAQAEEFSALKDDPRFIRVLELLSACQQPRGRASSLFKLPRQRGIIEGLAFRATTGDFFLADVHQRCVWRRDRSGAIERFTPEDPRVYGVFNIAIDETRGRLWAATSMMPAVTGYTEAQQGVAALVAFDLSSGALLGSYPIPTDGRAHVLGDLLLATDGAVFATDSSAPILWRLPPDAAVPEVFLTSAGFSSLQGLAPIGDDRLIVSDYANGLFVLDLAARTHQPLPPVADASLIGLDGLLARDGALIAVQNGIEPQRVLRITLSPDADRIEKVETLAAALPGLDDLTLLTATADGVAVIAQSGWAVLQEQPPATVPPHPVEVFAVPFAD